MRGEVGAPIDGAGEQERWQRVGGEAEEKGSRGERGWVGEGVKKDGRLRATPAMTHIQNPYFGE
jgi:hypothetical protein